jgi:hypothetical protein
MNAPRCRADQGPHHKGCTCEDWKQNIDLISGPIKLQAARTGGRGYEGKFVSHCPWCGARLGLVGEDAPAETAPASNDGLTVSVRTVIEAYNQHRVTAEEALKSIANRLDEHRQRLATPTP